MEFEALLSDKKLNMPKSIDDAKPLKISEDQEKAIELAQKMAQARIKKRHG